MGKKNSKKKAAGMTPNSNQKDHHKDKDGSLDLPIGEAESPVKDHKQQTSPYTRLTTISDLPNDVLRQIIPILPLETAAGTRLLSTRWRDLWDTIAVQQEHGDMNTTNLLTWLSGSVRWAFSPKSLCPRTLVFDSPEGDKLVAKVGFNKKLCLDFSSAGQDDSLGIDPLWVIRSCVPPWLMLRSIRLTGVGNVCNDIVSWLMSNFPSLESIEISKSTCVSSVNIHCMKPEKASERIRLSIIDCPVDSMETKRFDTLKSFRFRGRCPLRMEIALHHYLYRIEDVMLDFRQGPMNKNAKFDYHFRNVQFIKDARHVTMCGWTFETIFRPHLDSFEGFSCLKELWWIDNSMGEKKTESLITFLKNCPALQKLFVTIDPNCYSGGRRSAMSNEYEPDRWKRQKRRMVRERNNRLRDLRMVKMDFYENEMEMTCLADRILSITKHEPHVVSTSNSCNIRRLMRVHPNCPRMFLELEEDNSEMISEILNAKHMHMSI